MHAVGEFGLFDSGEGFGVVEGLEFESIEVAQGVEGFASGFSGDSFWVGDEEDGVSFGAALDALVDGGEEG